MASNAPEWMTPDNPALAEGARQRIEELHKKRSLRNFTISQPAKDKSKARAGADTAEAEEPVVVEFKDTRKNKDDEGKQDQFRWAILYEHQRGVTVFSTPYYSSRSLLPMDPPAFAVPDPGDSTPSHHPRRAPPNVTPTIYPLPDPSWRWVSESWLVDMRGDGEVQHDGFEYNWFFRRGHWSAKVGWLSAGGYVRRRRWIRLMMRPSETRVQAEAVVEDRGHEDAANIASGTHQQGGRVWRGDDGDWDRLRKALRDLTRDGPKLELWSDWLAELIGGTDAVEQAEKKVSTRERPSREWIITALRKHGNDLRDLFIYPDSQAQLRDLLVRAGLAQDVDLKFRASTSSLTSGVPDAPRDMSDQFIGPVDFWSSELDLSASNRSAARQETEGNAKVS